MNTQRSGASVVRRANPRIRRASSYAGIWRPRRQTQVRCRRPVRPTDHPAPIGCVRSPMHARELEMGRQDEAASCCHLCLRRACCCPGDRALPFERDCAPRNEQRVCLCPADSVSWRSRRIAYRVFLPVPHRHGSDRRRCSVVYRRADTRNLRAARGGAHERSGTGIRNRCLGLHVHDGFRGC